MKNKTDSNEQIQKYLYTEVNFLRYPLFIPTKGGKKTRSDITIKIVGERDGMRLELLWEILGSRKYGVPGFFDHKVFYALCDILTEYGFPAVNPLPFTIYDICRRLGLTINGKNFDNIRTSIKRMQASSGNATGTWYAKGEKKWIDIVFSIISEVIFKGKQKADGTIAEENLIYFGNWFLESWNSYYIKPIDFEFIKRLKSPIALRIYEYLGLRFYGALQRDEEYIRISYKQFCKFLQIRPQKYSSLAIRNLTQAHQELKDNHFIDEVIWDNWILTYYPGKKARREWEKSKVLYSNPVISSFDNIEQTQKLDNIVFNGIQSGNIIVKEEPTGLIGELIKRGISETVAKRLMEEYQTSQIEKQINYFDYLMNNNSSNIQKNPAGFLRKSIEENYTLPSGYKSYEQIEKEKIKVKKLKQEQIKEEKKRVQKEIDEVQDNINKRKAQYPNSEKYNKLWEQIKERLYQISPSSQTFLYTTFIGDINDNIIIIDFSSEFYKKWFNDYLIEQIREYIIELTQIKDCIFEYKISKI